MSNANNAAFATPWKDLWNGDLAMTDKIIAEDFVAHAAPLTGSGSDKIRGRDALNGWVRGIRSVIPTSHLAFSVGPRACTTATGQEATA